MTDVQLLTMALAVIVPLSLLIYSNTRIAEAKETLRAEIGTVRAQIDTLRAEIAALRTELNLRFDILLGKIEEIDNRLQHLR